MKKDGLAITVGIIMIIVGALGLLVWPILMLLGFAWTGGPPDYERSFSLYYVCVISAGFLGAILGLITGIMAVRNSGRRSWVKIAFTAVAAILCLPVIVLSIQLYVFPLTLLILLFSFAPPVIYLIRTIAHKI